MSLIRHVESERTPQSEPARGDQVKNDAGGFTFRVSDEVRLHRFLTIGTEGGTYYASERDLTRDNASVVVKLAKASSGVLIEQALKVSKAGRAPRNDAALFAMAAASGLGSEQYRAHALAGLPEVARTGSHLLTFAPYAELFRGWGPQLCKGIGRWYTSKDVDDLAYQLLKYKQRGGWSQRDLLRLSHFGRVPLSPEQRALFTYVMKGEAGDGLGQLVQSAVAAHATRKPAEWVNLIRANRSLSWEMLPSEALAEPDVWQALIAGGNLPQGALIRQLPRLTTLGVLEQGSAFTASVAGRLASAERLTRARVHPISVLLALKTYTGGHSLRGKGEWQPVPVIADALDAAFYASFPSVEPAGKRTMIGLDVSGSMGSPAGGLPLSCREVTAAMSMVTLRTEPQATVWGFTTRLQSLDLSSRRRLDDNVRAISGLPFGGTDCAQPILHAMKHRMEVDTFQIWTDSETWAGSMHPHQALDQYRNQMGINARLQVVAITPTEFSIADPLDPGSLDVSGFDSNVPALLADHSRGDI